MKTILTQDEYQNQFVDFYRQTLGTGIGTTVGPVDDDDEQDDGSSRPTVRDIGGGDAFNPMQGTNIFSGGYSNIDAGTYVRDNQKSAKKQMDKSDSGFANYMKNLGMQQLKERPGEVAVLGVASLATGLPLTAIGAVAGDLNRKKQFENATLIAASGGGNMMDLNGQTVSRAPGSKQYTGTLGNFTSAQIYELEELDKGYIPGTMQETFVPFPTAMTGGDSGDGNGTYTTTGKSGLLDAATAKALGGNYDAYGNWHSTKFGTVSSSGPLAGAKALASQYGVNTTGWTTQDYVNFSKDWKDSAKPSSTKSGIAGFFDNLFSNPLRDSTIDQYKTSLDKVKTNISNYSPGQQDEGSSDGSGSPAPTSTGGLGTIQELGFDDSDGGIYDTDDSDNSPASGSSSGTSMDASGEGGDSEYGALARGGRVGMQAGGTAAPPAGFVQGPPGQFSDRETVADDQPMEVPEGTFVINAPAVEHAGSQDIRKMILDAYTVAREKGLDIGRVDRKLYEGTVDVALSKGEVVIPPELAKIIGYDRLEKINNRGKKEVSRRQKASEGGFLGLAEGGTAEDPLGLSVEDIFDQPEDPAEYEDRIILDEVKRKMDALVKEYEDKGVDIRSIYDRNDPLTEGVGGYTQKSAEQTAFKKDISPNAVGPFFSMDDAYGLGPLVNVPKTPSLENLIIMAEEFAHQGANKRRAKQEQEGMSEQESNYAEEIRAKRIAFETVRGLLPQAQRGHQFSLDSYGENFLNYIEETTSVVYRNRVMLDLIRKYPELEETYKRTYGRGKGLKELEAKVAREEENVRISRQRQQKASGGFIDKQGYASGDKVTVYRGEPIDVDKSNLNVDYGYGKENVGKFHTPSIEKARNFAHSAGPGNQQILSRKVTIDELFDGVEEAWKTHAKQKTDYFKKMPKSELDKNVRFIRNMKKAYETGERSLESMVMFLQEQVFHDDKSKVNFIETFKNDPKSAGKLAGRAISKVATKATPPLAILEMVGTVFAPKTMGDAILQGNESFLNTNQSATR